MQDFNAFAVTAELRTDYITLKYAATTRAEWLALADRADRAVEDIRRDDDRIYSSVRSAGGHGRFVQSQLDMNDKFRDTARAVAANARTAAAKCLTAA